MTQKDKYYQLLNKYVKGELPDDERHDMEKKALDDPFFFDAMEGWMAMGDNSNHKDRLESLLLKIQGKKQTSMVRRILWPVAIAASLVLLFTVGNILVKDNDQALSINTSEEDVTEIIKSEGEPEVKDEMSASPESMASTEEEKEDNVPDSVSGEESTASPRTPSQELTVNRDIASQKKKSKDSPIEVLENDANEKDQLKDVASVDREQSEMASQPESAVQVPARGLPLSSLDKSMLKNNRQDNMAMTAGILSIIDPDLDDHIRKSLFMRGLKVFPGVRNSYDITFDSTLTITEIKLSSDKNDFSDYIKEFILKYNGWKKETIPPNLHGRYHFPPKQE